MKTEKKEAWGRVNCLLPAINRDAWFNYNPSLGKPLLSHLPPLLHHLMKTSLLCIIFDFQCDNSDSKSPWWASFLLVNYYTL
ncbi:hypothetical protein HanPSC8_Chr14g0618821 [Helianthus annuus]|nr:hypothetical protein HanPSC8_Chr14g0618821 [Helianthus annuus]